MFITGQKVVCVDAVGLPAWVKAGIYDAIPEQGKVYVVRGMSIGMTPPPNAAEELVVYLIGIQNRCSRVAPYPERGFNANRFRPLEDLTEEEILALSKPQEVEA